MHSLATTLVSLPDESTQENRKLNCYSTQKHSFHRSIWSTMRGGRERRRQNKKVLKGMRQAADTSVFCNISALVPVELNCEICICVTELGGGSHTAVLPPSTHTCPAWPLAPFKPRRAWAPTLEKHHSP